jgi:hypothetical protein
MNDIKKYEDKEKSISVPDQSFLETVEKFKEYWKQKMDFVAQQKTIHKAKQRVVGKEQDPRTGQWRPKEEDYLQEQFMRSALDKFFPGWSWKPAHEPIIVGNRAIISSGELIIIDTDLFRFLVGQGVPPERATFTRSFYGMGGALIQIVKETGNPAGISNNAKSAGTEALKYAINRLTRFGDDTYRKEDSDLGLTALEKMELSKYILESKMSEQDKEMAFERLPIVSSSMIEEFKKIIEQKEQENSMEKPEENSNENKE